MGRCDVVDAYDASQGSANIWRGAVVWERSPQVARVRVQRLTATAVLPVQATLGAAGFDLCSDMAGFCLCPRERAKVRTGIRVAIPLGFEGQVRPRSGLAVKHGVTVLNAPGTIDSDYRGEVVVLLVNLGQEAVMIREGDRVAQLVVAPVARVELVESDVDEHETARGAGGLGSTGR